MGNSVYRGQYSLHIQDDLFNDNRGKTEEEEKTYKPVQYHWQAQLRKDRYQGDSQNSNLMQEKVIISSL